MASTPRLALAATSALAAALLVPVVAATAATAAAPALPASCTQPSVGGAVTCTFGFTGSTHTFTVPAGVTSVDLTAWGGHGASNFQSNPVAGGRGAHVSGTFSVSPADQLTVTVGGDVSNIFTNATGAYGYGHGGSSDNDGVGAGGGGGSAVADGATLLLVAGAGGGSGIQSSSCAGAGAGGDAGQDGQSGATCQGHPAGAGGIAGGAATSDGGDSLQPGDSNGGGGGGGGFLGGTGGEGGDRVGGVITPSGGGGGGSSYAAASATSVSLTGLSDRSFGSNGQVQLTYEPSGPVSQVVMTPSESTVSVGTGQAFTVVGYDAGGASVADVSGDAVLSIAPDGACTASTCTPSAPGAHTVTATYLGLTATASLDATAPPAFTSSDSAVFVVGTAHDLTVAATGTPTPTLTVTAGAIPPGLSFTDHGDGTATLGGTATVAGQVDLTITASSSAGTATQVLHVLVATAPAFTSPDHFTFVNGIGHVVTVSASGSPAPALSVVGGALPDGLSLTDNGDGTATLGGNASIDGATDVTVKASNAAGDATQVVHLVVGTPPSFTSADHATFVRGRPGSFSVAVSGVPSPAISLGAPVRLPPGLSWTDDGDGTATLSGTATGRPGTRVVPLQTGNALGSASQLLTVVVAPVPGACANRFVGASGPDRVRGTAAGDRLVGMGGDDTLLGFAGQDCLVGGPGGDGLFGDRGVDRVLGGSGNDVLKGGTGQDLLRGGAGDDVIKAADGQSDLVSCGSGRDSVVADRRDVLQGCEMVTIR
jgi:Ca2+-binding RTX toxin-like protein